MTYIDREPLSLMPVPAGWRALYIDETDERGFIDMDLVALALYRITERPGTDSAAICDDPYTAIEGVVLDIDLGFEPAADAGNFWRYLRPGEADPGEADVAKATADDRERRERWWKAHQQQRRP